MKFNKKSLLFTFFLFLPHVFTLFKAQAIIPITDFKDVSEIFENTLTSPVYGVAWLDSGIISNIRFLMTEKVTYNNQGLRQYEKDGGTSPLWQIVKILFPSNGGILSTTSNHSLNLGRYITNPETVALLMKYSLNPQNEETAVEEIFATLNNIFNTLICNELKEKEAQAYTILDKINGEGWKVLLQDELKANPTFFLKENFQSFSKDKATLKTFRSKAEKEINRKTGKNQIENVTERFKNETLTSLITAIKTATADVSGFYPKGSIQKIISTFLCHHFDTRADLERYVSFLTNKNLNNNNVFIYENLKEIAKKSSYTLEEQVMLLMQDMWSSPTPYRENQKLINNGSCKAFDKKEEKETSEYFQDCTETCLRHFLNILFFYAPKCIFSLDHLKKDEEDEEYCETQYFKAVKDFYKFQPPKKANSGSEAMRLAWNRVVSGLNDKNPSIFYRRKNGNELASGFINFIKVINTLFNLKFDTNIQDEDHLTQTFEFITEELQPSQRYTIKSNNITESKSELYGTLTFKSSNGFSFELSINEGHSELIDVKNEDISSIFFEKEKITECDFKILDKELKKDVEDLFYSLMGNSLQDNNSKLKMLDTLSHFSSEFLQNKEKNILILVKNTLSSLGWEDQNVQKFLTEKEVIENLMKHAFLHEILKKTVKYVECKNDDRVSLQKKMTFFKNCHIFHLSNNQNISSISFTKENFPHIKELNISASSIKTLELKDLDFLKKFNADVKTDIKTFTAENLPLLEKLDLAGAPIQNFHLKNMESLNDINFPFSSKIKSFIAENLPSLKTVGFAMSSINTIDLKYTPHLQSLNLSHAWDLKKISLDKMLKEKIEINLKDASLKESEVIWFEEKVELHSEKK